jgi:ABC-type siderophore export system fused ATPase/permease subunit
VQFPFYHYKLELILLKCQGKQVIFITHYDIFKFMFYRMDEDYENLNALFQQTKNLPTESHVQLSLTIGGVNWRGQVGC